MEEISSKKVELNKKEREYLSGLIESHRSKIDFLSQKQKNKEPIKSDSEIADRLEKKLSL